MSDKIRVNYPALEDMASHCDKMAQKLGDTQQMAAKVAASMVDGALVGTTGEQFADALTTQFSSKVALLHDKFVEVAADIRGAINEMKQADTEAGGRF